jgi:hypothetical protein
LVTVLVAMTGDAPQIDVPAAMSGASLGSRPSSCPIQTVKPKAASNVAGIMPIPRPPTSIPWLEVN